MRISVYVTSYNQRSFLIEAIDSVLSQTLQPSEIIVVDDCSTDGSANVIAGYDSRYPDLIVPIYHTENQGVAQTRIDALQAVSADYVTYVDGDDRLLPQKLEKEARTLGAHPQAQIAFSNYYYIEADGTRTGLWADGELPPQGDIFTQVFARDFPRRSLFRNELVNYRAWQDVGSYDPQLNLYEDYDMRIRLTKQLKAAYVNEPLQEYRRHRDGLSRLRAARHLSALDYIYCKNRPLLRDLGAQERSAVKRGLYEWMRKIAYRAADQAWQTAVTEMEKGNRAKAMAHWLQYIRYSRRFRLQRGINLGLGARIMLPGPTYAQLRSAYHAVRGNGSD